MKDKVLRLGVTAIFLAVSLSGCTTLRRKFVRQKKVKNAQEDFVPVLEPATYQRVEQSSWDMYKSHYAMVKAYFGDVHTALSRAGSNEERERYLLGQVQVHVEKMTAYLDGTAVEKAVEIISLLKDSIAELDRPLGLRRYDVLKGLVRQVEKKIRKDLKPDMVKNDR